ncbi:hypothetical protein SH467x_004350 [Pirellulaceae bacterium SH467]
MRMKTWSIVALVSAGLCNVASAQDPLDEIYGRAVHQYFRGDSLTAEAMLNEVIAAGSQDPRVYFFRGLAMVRNGQPDAAATDFQKGADLEIAGKKVVNVGKALERIQGPHRMELEKARSQARLASRSKVLEIQRARYEAMQQQGGAAAGGLVVPPQVGVQPSPLAPNDPFVTGMKRGEPTPVEVPAVTDPAVPAPSGSQPATETPVPTGDDPFGSPAPTNPPASDDPFGTGN